MNIKTYPEFQALSLEMKPFFDAAFLEFPPSISEFTFTNLYSWKDIYHFSVSSLDDYILLRSGLNGKFQFFPPIAEKDYARGIIARVTKDAKAAFVRLPEEIAAMFKNDPLFNVKFDRDNSDYLYKIEDLKLLKGRSYDAKRNLIRKFKSEHGYEYIKLNPFNATACLDFEERWCVIRDCDNLEGLNNERQAIREMMNNFGDFNLVGAAIKVKGTVCAAAVAEKLNANTLVTHILKADPNIQGLYQAMLNDFLLNESGAFEYINLEQDLGLTGLRQAKLAYHPFNLVKKYAIKPA